MPRVEYDIGETSRNRAAGTITFHVVLTPSPTDEWVNVFHDFRVAEQGIGTIIDARIRGGRIDVEVPAGLDPSAAIRRCLDRTNEAMAKREG